MSNEVSKENEITTKEIIKITQGIVRAFMHEDGTFMDTPRVGTALSPIGRGIPTERIALLKDFVTLIMRTKYTNKYTKDYMLLYYTYEDVAKANTSINGIEELKPETVKSSIWYDVQKLRKEFGKKFFYGNTRDFSMDLGDSREKIDNLLRKLADTISTKLTEGLLIDIPVEETVLIEESTFEEFLDLIRNHTVKAKKMCSMLITQEMAGYYWYLIHNGEFLTGADAERYDRLKDCIL